MKDLNEKKWKRRQKCIRPNMALFWNQNISCWSFDRRAKRIREKRRKKRREGEEEEGRRRRRRRKKEKRSSRKIKGIDYYGFIWISMVWYDYFLVPNLGFS